MAVPTAAGQRISVTSKIDPSFKSKRYRDKLRTEIKALEALIPVDRSTLHRKLDSQTVFRLVIAYFRTKMFFDAAGLEPLPSADGKPPEPPPKKIQTQQPTEPDGLVTGKELLQAMDGFLLVVTSDGTILYVTPNILQHLGFNQIDLMHRCIYGIVHPDDHYELKVVLEQTLSECRIKLEGQQQRPCCAAKDDGKERCKSVSFLCRIKCFNGTTTGYLKMHCIGHMRAFPLLQKSNRTSAQVMFTFCRPFISMNSDPDMEARSNGFWSKHELDLKFKQMDKKAHEIIGYTLEELEGISMYQVIHPEDLAVFSACHKTLTQTEEIQTMYFRFQTKDGKWMWLHTRGKVVFKNSKKYSIVFTHCPVREEDSTYIQQEVALRQRYAIQDIIVMRNSYDGCSLYQRGVYPNPSALSKYGPYGNLREEEAMTLHSPHGQCPSSWHANSERHSPVFPSTHLPHKYYERDKFGWFMEQNKPQQTEFGVPGLLNQDLNDCAVYGNRCAPLCQVSNCRFPVQTPKHYFMHFNGVGITPPPNGPYVGQQSCPTTMYFHGQVTAIEANQNPVLPSCQYVAYDSHNVPVSGGCGLLSPPPSPVTLNHQISQIPGSLPIRDNRGKEYYQQYPIPDGHIQDFPPAYHFKEEYTTHGRIPLPFPDCGSSPVSEGDVSGAIHSLSVLATNDISNMQSQIDLEPGQKSCVFSQQADDSFPFPTCHMSVVEPSLRGCPNANLDLPSIGSFLEYLQES